jgi:glutamine amidotransferase PdxT
MHTETPLYDILFAFLVIIRMMSQENSVDLSKSVKDVLQAAQVPQEFVTEPIIEEKITEVYVQVFEKEIVEVPQVRYIAQSFHHSIRFNMWIRLLKFHRFKFKRG